MKIFISTIGLACAILPNVASCETKVTNSMHEVQALFDQSADETLGVFDIDMVLLHSDNAAFQMQNMMAHKPLLKKLLSNLSPLEKDLAHNLSMQQGNAILLDATTPAVIKKIQSRHSKVIALTAALTGSLGAVPDLLSQRYEHLKALDIDFSSSFPQCCTLVMRTIDAYRQNHPEFRQDILVANGEHGTAKKGRVLVEFLKIMNYQPETVIFVDDREHNVKDVEQALQAYNANIRYIGIVYKGGENFPSRMLDEQSFENAWTKLINHAKDLANEHPIELLADS